MCAIQCTVCVCMRMPGGLSVSCGQSAAVPRLCDFRFIPKDESLQLCHFTDMCTFVGEAVLAAIQTHLFEYLSLLCPVTADSIHSIPIHHLHFSCSYFFHQDLFIYSSCVTFVLYCCTISFVIYPIFVV